MMLGMSIFTLLGGVFAETGSFQDGYKDRCCCWFLF